VSEADDWWLGSGFFGSAMGGILTVIFLSMAKKAYAGTVPAPTPYPPPLMGALPQHQPTPPSASHSHAQPGAPGPPVPPGPPQPPAKATAAFCTQCGGPLPSEARFCRSCGSVVRTPPSTSTGKATEPG
jgi:hypothetical protein